MCLSSPSSVHLSILYKCVHAGDAMNMEIVARRQLREMSRPGNIYWNFTEIFIEILEKYLLKRKRNVYWSQVRNLKLPTHKTDEIFAGLFLPFRHHTSSPTRIFLMLSGQGYLCVIGQCHWYILYKGSMTMTMTMTMTEL